MRTNRPILSTFAVGLAEAMKAIKQLPLHLAACFGFFLYLFEELVELSMNLKEGIGFCHDYHDLLLCHGYYLCAPVYWDVRYAVLFCKAHCRLVAQYASSCARHWIG